MNTFELLRSYAEDHDSEMDPFEASCTGPSDGNPYRDVALAATFSQANRKV